MRFTWILVKKKRDEHGGSGEVLGKLMPSLQTASMFCFQPTPLSRRYSGPLVVDSSLFLDRVYGRSVDTNIRLLLHNTRDLAARC